VSPITDLNMEGTLFWAEPEEEEGGEYFEAFRVREYMKALKLRNSSCPSLCLTPSTAVPTDELPCTDYSRQATSSSAASVSSKSCHRPTAWVMSEKMIKEATVSAVLECEHSAALVDPRAELGETAIEAVSAEFEALTGWKQDEAVGKSFRFLQKDCPADTQDFIVVRTARLIGLPVTVLLANRRKSGELFWNLTHFSGITVAYNPQKEEDLWFLLATFSDVTHVGSQDELEEHARLVESKAHLVREDIADRLRIIAGFKKLKTADVSTGCATLDSGEEPMWCALAQPILRKPISEQSQEESDEATWPRRSLFYTALGFSALFGVGLLFGSRNSRAQ